MDFKAVIKQLTVKDILEGIIEAIGVVASIYLMFIVLETI